MNAQLIKQALAKRWSPTRRMFAYQQTILADAGFAVGTIDGLLGPQTLQALEDWERAQQGLAPNNWRDKFELPDDDSYQTMVAMYGQPGDWNNMREFKLPYDMYLAWDLNTTVSSITLHKLVGDDVVGVLERTRGYYGDEAIAQNGLNLFGGGLSVRKKHGGSAWSTHAWGVAVDIDPLHNQLRWDHTQAHLAQPACEKFIQYWLDAGWISLGKSLDYDWMHFQKAAI